MTGTTKDRTLALAGVMQAAALVSQVAQTGQCSGQAADASLSSIYVSDPEETIAVFGGLQGLRLGLRTLIDLLGPATPGGQLHTLQIALSLLKLGRQLGRDRPRLSQISEAIELTRSAWDTREGPLDASVTAQLADAYERHISSLKFRIRVQGNPEILKNPIKVQLVRGMLLAGLRAAILWQQVGGNQWRLITGRRAMVAQAQSLI